MSNSLSTLINKVQILIYLVHYRCLNYSAVWYFSALWYQIFGLLVFIYLAFLPCLIETLHKNVCIELAPLRNAIIEKSNLNHEFIEFILLKSCNCWKLGTLLKILYQFGHGPYQIEISKFWVSLWLLIVQRGSEYQTSPVFYRPKLSISQMVPYLNCIENISLLVIAS